MIRRLTNVRLSRRNLAASRSGLIALAVVVLVATAAIIAWPRLTGALLGRDLTYRVASAGAVLRDLQSSVDPVPPPSYADFTAAVPTVQPVWDALPDTLTATRRAMPPTLRAIVEPGRYVGRNDGQSGNGVQASGSPHPPVNSSFNLSIEANPQLKSDANLDQGAWPAAVDSAIDTGPIEVVTTTASAKVLQWKVGETQTLTIDAYDQKTVILSGTISPRDAQTDYWQLDRSRAAAGYVSSPDGDHKTYHGVIWMDSSSWPAVAIQLPGRSVRSWYPVDAAKVTVDSLPTIGADLQRFLSVPRPIGTSGTSLALRFSTGLQSIMDDFVARAAPANALLAVIGTGPLGTGLAVLLLGIILLVDRRFASLALIRSRGASGRRIRVTVAVETAIATVPAAILGAAAALLLTPGAVSWAVGIPVAFCALAPPVAAALRAGAPPAKTSRAGISRRSGWRWVIEVLLVALAALAVVLLLQRGLAPASAAVGADPLLTLVPLLVVAAACVIVLRFFPWVLGWLGAVLRRRKSAVGYIGWATAARGRTRFIPVFAVIAGVGVSVFSLSVLATERDGIRDAALGHVGAELSITGTAFSAQTVHRFEAIPGLGDITPIDSAGGVSLSGTDENVALFVVDGKRLAAVQAALPAALRKFSALGETVGGRPVALAGGFQQKPRTDATIEGAQPIPVHLVEQSGQPPKFLSSVPWILIDKTALPAHSTLPSQALAVLASVAPGTNVAALRARILALAGGGAEVTTADDIIAGLRAAPLVSGLEDISWLALALSALMCITALVLTLVMNAGERIRLIAELRVLGFSRRQTSGLTAWELGPMAVVGILAGAGVGAVLAVIVVASIDLSGFVGGDVPPLLVIDPLFVAEAVGGFALAALLAIFIAIGFARRISPARVLRFTGED